MKNKNVRVLVVEDNPNLLEDLTNLLLLEGHEVTAVATPGRALRAVTNQEFDIAIVDVCLPEMDGFGLSRLLMSVDHPPAVYLISGGKLDLTTFRLAKTYGAIGIYQKPFGVETMIAGLHA